MQQRYDHNDLYADVESTSKCLRFLRLLWKFCRCIFSHVTLVSLVVAYCVLGAYAFESLEAAHEIEVKRSIKYVRSNVTKRIWDITESAEVLIQEIWTDDIVKQLVVFEKELLEKMKKDGWDGSEEVTNIQWTFAGALFYSIIVITTIGYGHIAPKTQNGKVVTIFYAILGIPLMLLCLSNIGDVMASSFRFLYWKICCYVCTRPSKPPRRSSRHHSNMLPRSQSLRQSSGRYAAASSLRASSLRSSTLPPATSGIGPSVFPAESMGRSFHSDTDCSTGRRYVNRPIGVATGNVGPQSALSSRYRSNGSPIPLASPRTIIKVGARSLDRKCHDTELTAPVLFNKYAIDHGAPAFNDARARKDNSSRSWTRTTSPQRCRSVEPSTLTNVAAIGRIGRTINDNPAINDVDLEIVERSARIPNVPGNLSSGSNRMRPRSINAHRTYKREPSSARIMSPMGFAVHRQVYADDLELDYDYLTNNSGGVIGDGDDDDLTALKPVPIWLCVFLVVSYILGGAFLFAEWETWPYLDSAYFCFITLTTIGFGDLVPAHRLNAHQGIALCSLYLLFGIALLAMSFNLVQEEVINNVKNVAKRLGIIKEDHGTDVDYEQDYYEYEEQDYPFDGDDEDDVDAVVDDEDVDDNEDDEPQLASSVYVHGHLSRNEHVPPPRRAFYNHHRSSR